MKQLSIFILSICLLGYISCNPKSTKKEQKVQKNQVEFVKNEAGKKVDILVDGNLFTSYQWPDGVYKPILFPIRNSIGTTVTRGFPLNPKTGERSDHIHQVGNWLNYGNVNGSDFWGNGHSGSRSSNGGEIKHIGIEKLESTGNEGLMITNGVWIDSLGNEVLSEKTEYHFIANDSVRIIDRITKLTALGLEVFLPDTKEGMFAIRVARELELPSKGRITFINAKGETETLDSTSNVGISGNYISSEGITGLEVWGTRAKWMNLFGNIDDDKISIVICDHPKNINYPTYWHARGYGLFSANPLGEKDFTKGEKELNLSIAEKQTLTFRYRIIISSGKHLNSDEIESYSNDFSGKYLNEI